MRATIRSRFSDAPWATAQYLGFLKEGAVRKSDQQQFLRLMKRLLHEWRKGKLLPIEIFESVLKFCLVHVSVEMVFLRRRKIDGRWRVQVFLKERETERAYHGLWHSPGSYIRQGERFTDVIRRIERDEVGPARVGRRRFAGVINYLDRKRGHTVSPVFVCRLIGTPKTGRWFDVNNLPKNFVPIHHDLLRLATMRNGRLRHRVALVETTY